MTTDPDKKLPYNPPDAPNWRAPVGVILMLVFVLIWSGIVVSLIDRISDLNFWLQLPIYVIAGIIWIYPIKPLLLWINTGKFRS